MKQQLRTGSNSILVKGQSFGRAYLLIQGVGAGNLVAADFSLANLRIRIDLNQADLKDSTSFNAVGPVAKGVLDYANPSFATDMGFSANGQTCRGKLLPNSTTQSTFSVPLLDGGYILRGEDSINFIIEILPGFYTTNSSASSSVNLVIESANSIEQIDINLPVYEPITNDRQSPAYTYDACSEIALINSVVPFSFSAEPFTSIDVRSKHVNDSFDSLTLADKRLDDIPQTALIGSSKIFYVEPDTLEQVQCNLNITTGNVTIGSQFLYVRKTLMSSQLTARSISHQNKIESRKLNSRGITPQGLDYIKKAGKMASYRNSKN
jgi:hypothetical protein